MFLPVLGAAIAHAPVLTFDLFPGLKRPLDGGASFETGSTGGAEEDAEDGSGADDDEEVPSGPAQASAEERGVSLE